MAGEVAAELVVVDGAGAAVGLRVPAANIFYLTIYPNTPRSHGPHPRGVDLLLGVRDPVPVVVVDVLGGGARAAAGDQDVAAELSRGSAVVRLIIVRKVVL